MNQFKICLLQHADRRWFALYKDFVFENIAVSHDKEIFILDYEELSIIENLDFDEPNGLYYTLCISVYSSFAFLHKFSEYILITEFCTCVSDVTCFRVSTDPGKSWKVLELKC